MNSSTYARVRNLRRLLLSRKTLAALAAVGVLGATAITVFGSAEPRDEPAAAMRMPTTSLTVNAITPKPMSFTRSIAATGSISARDELVIGSDASGVRLLEVLVDVGSTVHKGQLLARADDAQLRAQLAQQDALIKQAQAEAAQAEANLERADRVKDSGVYSVEAVQTRRTNALAANAKFELALAQRRELEVKIAQTRVVAPAGGVIAKKSATVGAVVQPGSEMFRLIKDGQLEWLAELPSHSLAKVPAGAKARVALDDGRMLDATVRLVAPTLDATTRNGLVHVTLPQGHVLRPGSHAKGEILMESAQALSLPESSVLTRDGYPFVYLIGPDQIAKLTRIETGARQRGVVEVIGGLHPDARVVATGAGFVKDGDLVRVAPETPQQIAKAGGQS